MHFVEIQLLGVLAWLCGLVSYWAKDKKKILAIQVVGDLFYAIHYFLLGAYTGGFTQAMALFRELGFFCCKKPKQEKKFFFLLVPIYMIIGSMTFSTTIDIFPILASITYCYTLTMAAHWIVIGGIIDAIYWLFYDLVCQSYAGVFADIMVIISNTLALIHRKGDSNLFNK